MKDLININRLNRFGQNIWTRIKDVFMTKEDAINGVLVGQEWTKIGSITANNSIILPSTDTFTELYIEMYSSNGTITHNINIRLDSILFESSNNEYREILLDSVYDAQTYVKYNFATNSIIPIMYEGNEINNSSTEITTNVYTKTNNLEVGNVEAEKITIDNSVSGMNADNVQGAIDELKGTIGYSKKNLLKNKAVNRTLFGVTHTVNNDGTIVSNGTNTSSSFSIITLTGTADSEYVQIDNLKDGEEYILNGCPSGGGEETYGIRLVGYNSGNHSFVEDYCDFGEGVKFTYNASLVYRFYISVSGSVTVNNLTFKPMIRYSSIKDDTYEPYVEDVQSRLLTIKQKQVTVNTDANGNAILSLPSTTHVINISCVSHSAMGIIPFITQGNWYARCVKNSSTYTPLASETVTIVITYLE